MNTVQCDVCKKCEPEVWCRYSLRKRRWSWRRFDPDSQGGSTVRLDICDQCWRKMEAYFRTAAEEVAKAMGE